MVASTFPVAMFHSMIVLSPIAVARFFPSGEKAKLLKVSVCSLRVCTTFPEATSNNVTVLLVGSKATVFPSGEKVG